MKRGLQFIALAAALAAAFGAAASASGGARGRGQTPTPINPAVTYARNCATCHGKDGRARTFKSKHHVHARDLTDARWQEEATDERIFNSIENGRGKMPAFKRKLTNEQIESLVAYVRSLKR
jgi:mono/diheme cytochrome c family protein